MDDVVVDCARFIDESSSTGSTSNIPSQSRLLIAIAGVPASGKTSFASRLVQVINTRLQAKPSDAQAVLVGLDGWHLTRSQLDTWMTPNMHMIGVGYTGLVYAPSFDHARTGKDPTPDAVIIQPSHRIVVIEGLYTMLDVDPWREAAAQMDERWWIQIDTMRAKTRLAKRHLQTGFTKDMDEAIWHAENNDEDNGKFVSRNLFNVTYTIQSIDDPAYST